LLAPVLVGGPVQENKSSAVLPSCCCYCTAREVHSSTPRKRDRDKTQEREKEVRRMMYVKQSTETKLVLPLSGPVHLKLIKTKDESLPQTKRGITETIDRTD
jgi:hypothetical protein